MKSWVLRKIINLPGSIYLTIACVVAVKFLGPQLSLCRPAHDTKWTNIRIKDPSFFTSHVMFSQRDQLFSLPASGGNHIRSWDLLKHKSKPKLQKLHFQNIPTLKKELWDSCYRTEHLVESSAGETFLVFWYRSVELYMPDAETKGFMVFLVDEEGNATYTEDIGDLCISYQSLSLSVSLLALSLASRDYIFYVDFNESYQDIERGGFSLCRANSAENFSKFHMSYVPYYFPPQPIQ